MVTLLVTVSQDRRWPNELARARAWEEALVEGLRQVGAPAWDRVSVLFADYAGAWRHVERTDDISPIEAEFARELLERSAGPAPIAQDPTMWSGLSRLVRVLDEQAGIGDEVVVESFLNDLGAYFGDTTQRATANAVVATAAESTNDEVILLGHGIGSIVGYVSLHEEARRLDRIRGFVTFGSPLGMEVVRSRVAEIVPGVPFPDAPRRWINLFDEWDFATSVPLLGPIFRAADGRQVEDASTTRGQHAASSRARAHDALGYVSAGEFASRLRDLIDEVERSAGASSSMGSGSPRQRHVRDELPPMVETPAAGQADVQPEPEAPATRSWPGEPAGAAPPWLDGAVPPWLDDDEPQDK
jgi:hypothetical protein